jgi:hypothetical protein
MKMEIRTEKEGTAEIGIKWLVTLQKIAHRGVLDEGLRFLQKPFSVNSLAAKVREVLDEIKFPSSGFGDLSHE